jgi:hypothetical protein
MNRGGNPAAESLSPEHRAMLEGSGIAEDVIAARGYRTVRSFQELMLLGFVPHQSNVPGLLVPIYGPDGSISSHQYRPDRPRQNKAGKPVKYETPTGAKNRLDIPPTMRAKLADPGIPLWITEGVKKADVMASRGHLCAALPGVWCWKTKNEHGGSVVIGDLHQIPLKGRTCFVAYDSDAVEKVGVRKAEEGFAAFLRANGANVRIVRVPSGPNREKQGLDDFLVAGGTVEELLERTAEPEAEEVQGLELVRLSDVEAEDVEWLWYPYLPLGKLSLLMGRQGEAKSWVTHAIAAAVTRGWALPGGKSTEPGNVLICTAEDGAGDTLRPRLEALGADLDRVFVFTGFMTLAGGGLNALMREAERLQAKLIVLDPIQAFIGAEVDAHRANEIRPILQGLIGIAQACKCSVLGLGHTTKGAKDGHAVHALLGSTDYTAAARSVLLQGKDPEASRDAEALTIGGLVHVKCNLAPLGPAIGFRIENGEFTWAAECDMTEEMILKGIKGSAMEEAADFLRAELADGPVEQARIKQDAEVAGLSWASVRRAKERLGVASERRGVAGKRGGGGWYWCLDAQDPLKGKIEHVNGAQVQEREDRAEVEHVNTAPMKQQPVLAMVEGEL